MSDSDSEPEPVTVPEPKTEPVTEPEKVSYEVLKAKLRKVDMILAKMCMKTGDKEPETKEYRAYLRKQKEYSSTLNKNRVYREEKLQAAIDALRECSKTVAVDDIGISLHSVDLLDGEDDSGSEKSFEEEKPDYELTLKKYNKVGRILQDFKEEHGDKDATKRKDFKRYSEKHFEYLADLECCPEWEEEKKFQEEEAQQLATDKKQDAIEEKDRLRMLAIAKDLQKAELEIAKAAALTKLRAKSEIMEAQERAVEAVYEMAKNAEDKEARKEGDLLEAEMAEREKEFSEQLREQEELGILT
jgi:hypothetical protein